jgi:multidrug efflux system membrane fusion protein
MSFQKLWIAGLCAAALAVSGTYLWREGIPSSVMKSAANTSRARPVPVTVGVVKDQEFAVSRVDSARSRPTTP